MSFITIVAKENLADFYDEIEDKLCGGKNSGFGRNLDAMWDVLTGDFGKLRGNKREKRMTTLVVQNSNLLTPKIHQMFKDAIINSEHYYEPHYTHSHKWLTIEFT
jgi:hypothetical protein